MSYDFYFTTTPGVRYDYANSLLDKWLHNSSLHKKPSKIRVTLSRPLTWAEWDFLVAQKAPYISVKRDQGRDFSVIHITSERSSRESFQHFAKFLAEEFVNVFPKSVLTRQESQ